MYNLFEPILGEDKETFLRNLSSMYFKNARVLNLVKLFNLEWACHPLEESMNTEQIIEYLTNLKKTEIMSNKAPNKKFKNEVEATPNRVFVKFENTGDSIECKCIGRIDIKGAQDKINSHVVCVDVADGEEKLLPTNVQLTQKLNNLEKTKGNFSDTNQVECYIEYLGDVKIDGVANKVKSFKVLTT